MDASIPESEVNGNATEPLLVTAEQAAASLSICRTKVYELLRNGELESVRIGTSRRIPAAALTEYVERLRAGQTVPTDAWPLHQTILRPGRSD
jgi:excisionase family DNA binding protein